MCNVFYCVYSYNYCFYIFSLVYNKYKTFYFLIFLINYITLQSPKQFIHILFVLVTGTSAD